MGLLAARLVQEVLVEQPALRGDQSGVGGAALVLGAGGGEGEEAEDRALGSGGVGGEPRRGQRPGGGQRRGQEQGEARR
ncbi:hypothetical protein [Streptomyces sp. NPDC058335]|uniref:hypothetical protein n=1 Tax=Streptomyces sp. NPDC058335 TaxID=3346451 RepID=UPI0036510C5E